MSQQSYFRRHLYLKANVRGCVEASQFPSAAVAAVALQLLSAALAAMDSQSGVRRPLNARCRDAISDPRFSSVYEAWHHRCRASYVDVSVIDFYCSENLPCWQSFCFLETRVPESKRAELCGGFEVLQRCCGSRSFIVLQCCFGSRAFAVLQCCLGGRGFAVLRCGFIQCSCSLIDVTAELLPEIRVPESKRAELCGGFAVFRCCYGSHGLAAPQ